MPFYMMSLHIILYTLKYYTKNTSLGPNEAFASSVLTLFYVLQSKYLTHRFELWCCSFNSLNIASSRPSAFASEYRHFHKATSRTIQQRSEMRKWAIIFRLKTILMKSRYYHLPTPFAYIQRVCRYNCIQLNCMY